jgi:hypothetical protein
MILLLKFILLYPILYLVSIMLTSVDFLIDYRDHTWLELLKASRDIFITISVGVTCLFLVIYWIWNLLSI